jgi:hypothetical protein
MPVLPAASAQNDYGPYKGSAFNHHFIIQNVIDVLNGRATITATAEEGKQVIAIIENMYKAVKK